MQEDARIIKQEDLKRNLQIKGRFGDILASLLYRWLRFDQFNRLYLKYKHLTSCAFADSLLRHQNISLEYDKQKVRRLKEYNSLVVVSNHPHGLLDGLILIQLFGENGISHTRVVANSLLSSVAPLSDNLIIVTTYNKSKDHHLKFRSCKRVLNAFTKDGLTVFFPSAEVSSLNIQTCKIEDPAWNSTFFKMIRNENQLILPVFIYGRNSCKYQILVKLYSRLGFLMLVSEFLKIRDRNIVVKIGVPFSKGNLTTDELSRVAKQKVYSLKGNS